MNQHLTFSWLHTQNFFLMLPFFHLLEHHIVGCPKILHGCFSNTSVHWKGSQQQFLIYFIVGVGSLSQDGLNSSLHQEANPECNWELSNKVSSFVDELLGTKKGVVENLEDETQSFIDSKSLFFINYLCSFDKDEQNKGSHDEVGKEVKVSSDNILPFWYNLLLPVNSYALEDIHWEKSHIHNIHRNLFVFLRREIDDEVHDDLGKHKEEECDKFKNCLFFHWTNISIILTTCN